MIDSIRQMNKRLELTLVLAATGLAGCLLVLVLMLTVYEQPETDNEPQQGSQTIEEARK